MISSQLINHFQQSLQFLCTPASSVPCEQAFSKDGELAPKKRNRFKTKTLGKIIFKNVFFFK